MVPFKERQQKMDSDTVADLTISSFRDRMILGMGLFFCLSAQTVTGRNVGDVT